MPRFTTRNDGLGPYAVFYCDSCAREYRSQPDVSGTIATDIGRRVASDAVRRIPLFGHAVANSLIGSDRRYITALTPEELEKHWDQSKQYFRECGTCRQIVCLSDFDEQNGVCKRDSPRAKEIAQAETEQAARVAQGFAGIFGLGAAVKNAAEAVQRAAAAGARCPKDGTIAPAGTKFCPSCGATMVQPPADLCPACGADARGARFCPSCGGQINRATASAICPACGADARGARFCPSCGAKMQ